MLLDGTTLSDHTVRIGAIAGLPCRPEAKRTSKPTNVTFALGNLIGDSVEETLWFFRADSYRANRKSLGGGGCGAAEDQRGQHKQR